MKNLSVFLLFVLIGLTLQAQEQKVYFAKPVDSKGFMIEDYITFNKNINSWGQTEYGMDYDKYDTYIKNILKKYSSYNDTIREYYISEWKDEFSKLTDIKPGSKVYISSPERIYKTQIGNYFISTDDEIYGGVMFYPLADYKNRSAMPEYDVLVCSDNPKITKIDNAGITEKNTTDKIKAKLLPKFKNLTYTDWTDGKETSHKVKSIADDEIKIFKGNFRNKSGEYLVSYTKRLTFDKFASAIYITDENGNITETPSNLIEDFTYIKSIGTIDTDNDSVLEIIIESGYYEGAGYMLWKNTKDGYIPIANGFNWGV